MRFNRLDLNLLVALDALLSEQSITRASLRLNLSQSATSGILGKLREYFEDELLTQVGRSMRLTALGRELQAPVREVMRQIQSTIETRADFDPATATRHFRIIASDYSAAVLVPELARQMASQAPKVTLELLQPNSDHATLLERGEVDVVIMPSRYLVPGQPHELIVTDPYICIVWDENAHVGDAVSLEQYLALGHVTSNFGRTIPSFEEWFLQSSGIHRRVELNTSSFSSVPLLVVGTERIATLQGRLARLFGAFLPLRLLPPPVAIPALEVHMQWHKFLDNDPSHAWLRATLRAAANSEPGLFMAR